MFSTNFIILGCVLLAVVVLVCFLAFGSDSDRAQHSSHKDVENKAVPPPHRKELAPYGRISQDLSSFRAQDGRRIIFHGVNVINKSAPYYPLAFDAKVGDASNETAGEQWCKYLKSVGFNAVRLGFLWTAVEPLPGQYDEVYLAKMREIVSVLAKHGLYFILNFHQDRWSDGNIPLTPGSANTFTFSGDGNPVWTARFDGQTNNFSGGNDNPALNAVWTNFWNNVPAYADNGQTTSDSIGVQDRYIAMRKYVARMFRNEPNLLYHGMMNEVLVDNNTWMALGEPNLLPDWEINLNLNTFNFGVFPPSLLLQNSFDPTAWNQTATGSCYNFFLTLFPQFREKLRRAIEESEENGESHLIGQELSFYETLGKIANVPEESTRHPKNLVMARSSYGIKDLDYIFGQPDKQNELVYNQSRATAALNGTGFFAQEWGAGLENTGFDYEPVMKYFDEKHISWTYWDALSIPTSFPGLSFLFRNPASIGGWFAATQPSKSSVSYNSADKALQLNMPLLSPNSGSLIYGQYSYNTFETNYFAGDLSAGRTMSVVLKAGLESTSDLSQIFVKIAMNDGTNGFIQLYFATGALTTSFQTLTFPIPATVVNVNQIYVQVGNTSATASGSLNLEIQNMTISGAPLVVPESLDLFFGTGNGGDVPNINSQIATMIVEPYPQITAGTILDYSYDFTSKTFQMSYLPEVGVTRIAVPKACYPSGYNVAVERAEYEKFGGFIEVRANAAWEKEPVKITITPK